MNSFGRLISTVSIVIASALTLAGCSKESWNYWWTRGQPPSTNTLIERADDKLTAALNSPTLTRGNVGTLAMQIQSSLNKLSSSTDLDSPESQELFLQIEDGFMSLEGMLSIGSRAPYGELLGQLRRLKHEHTPEGVRLFTARSFFFLANELETPAPTFG